jgi:hypothetical protein
MQTFNIKSGIKEKAFGGLSSPYTTVPSILPPKSPYTQTMEDEYIYIDIYI